MSQAARPSTPPPKIWWARPRKLALMERPGGGGRSHRPDRRRGEIDWLRDHGVRVAISTMATRHNLGDYDDRGLEWHHVPVAVTADGGDALEEVLGLLRAELRRAGAAVVHGNRHTDFVAAVGAAHLHAHRGIDPADGLASAAAAGLMVTPASCALVGVDPAEVGALAPEAGLAATA